jgi:hypothetical protein
MNRTKKKCQRSIKKKKKPKNLLLEFFRNSPLPEIELDIQRSKDDFGRNIIL